MMMKTKEGIISAILLDGYGFWLRTLKFVVVT